MFGAPVAWALEVGLAEVQGPPAPGEEVVVEVVVADSGVPAAGRLVDLSASRGVVVAQLGEGALGRYRFRYRAPLDTRDDLRIIVDGVATPWTLAVAAPPPGVLSPAREIEGAAGVERLQLRFPTTGVVDPAQLQIRSSEGRVLAVRAEPDTLVVEVAPEEGRQARVLVVGVLDERSPGLLPVFGVVRLRGRQQGTITAEPGSTVSIRVAGRAWGPFVADAAGKVELGFDVPPGVSGYEILVSDDLGNTQRVQSPLPAPRPALLAMAVSRAGATSLVIGGWASSGTPWAGSAPECRAGDGVRIPAAEIGRGLYRFAVVWPEQGGGLDLPVACALGDQASLARLTAPPEPPARVTLELWPEAVSADFPVAQVQAVLLDRYGERVRPEGLDVVASLGGLTNERAEGAWRATWRGDGSPASEALFTAEYRRPAGSGAPWDVELWAAAAPDGVGVRGRVLDRRGLPLPGVEVQVGLRGEGEGTRVVADAAGWISTTIPRSSRSVAVLEARVGTVERRITLVEGAGPGTPPAVGAPDLWARAKLPIRAGRVRQVYIDASPRPLTVGAGESATITVRLLDEAGREVADEVPEVRASAGVVGAVVPAGPGAWRASYVPPEGATSGTVRITAESGGAAGATDLELVPRPVRGSVGITGGWTTNFGGLSSPTFGVVGDVRLPRGQRNFGPRVGVHVYQISATVPSDLGEVQVEARVVPIELGAMLEQRAPRRVFAVGASGIVAPYLLQVDFDGQTGVHGTGMFAPGVQVFGSGAARIGGAELVMEARYLLLTAPSGSIRFQGSVGGASLSLGYRLLY